LRAPDILTSVTISIIPDYIVMYSKPNDVLSNESKCLSLATMARHAGIVVLLQDMEMKQLMVWKV
jgi:hypothetical protein